MVGRRQNVVIIGGGFAGINAAKTLAESDGVNIKLIDKRNHHLFQPLLYQVAMAGLSPADISTPIRAVFGEHANIDVKMGTVESINLEEKLIQTDFGSQPFDYLVLACGSYHHYFGNNHWEQHAPGLKNLAQATEIRRRVLLAFEMAERCTDPVLRREYLTFVVIGGGPTGVELAGAIGELSSSTLAKDFRSIDPRSTRIILVEAGPRILSSFSEKSSACAQADLEELGVEVLTNTMVTDVNAEGVQTKESFIKSKTKLWAAGVRASSLGKRIGVEESLQKDNRIKVNQDLSIPGHPNVFVAGDQACFIPESEERPIPALAPVAMQQGRHAAKNVLLDIRKKERKPFKYVDKGQMATIGRKKAVAESGNLKLKGRLAWLAWLLVHIFYLIGFRNRVMVLLQWIYAYAWYRRGARLVINKKWKHYASE